MSFSASGMTKFRSLQLEGHDENGRQSEFLAGGNSNMCVLCSPWILGKDEPIWTSADFLSGRGWKTTNYVGFLIVGFEQRWKMKFGWKMNSCSLLKLPVLCVRRCFTDYVYYGKLPKLSIIW